MALSSVQSGMNEHGLYDIYDTWHVPFWQTKTWHVCLLIIGLLIMTAIIGLFIKWYRSRKIVLSPWEHALLGLKSLRKNNQATADCGKEFYGALTSILKKYLHERYGFDTGVSGAALAKTDEEFLYYIEKKGFSSDFMADLQTIFLSSVTIKFANMQALQNQIDRDLELAISFVRRTVPVTTKTATRTFSKKADHINEQSFGVEK